MLKKTMTYTDYDGVSRTEDFYFNLTKAELMELEATTDGGFSVMVNKILAAQDQKSLIKVFKDFILKAYGEKSPDGKLFMKSEEIRNRFLCTEAYSDLFMLLATNTEAATEFITGVAPADLVKEAQLQTNIPELTPVE